MPKNSSLNKGARTYVESALSTASHPIRRKILKHLKNRSKSTLDLETETNEDRYNLYHHLGVLEKSGLIRIDKNKSEGKLKYYEMNYVENPTVAAFTFDKQEINAQIENYKKLYDILKIIENHPNLPDIKTISKIEVCISYE